ncbi:hypothetical protein V498_08386 [Pseudogymnoascus sp. VKM F-4517 (FW-2822)]|nr:hypothetical protein V498_08386 [Pseudogymnoascus sp. VKM F-4517 (FW-2822)]
MAATTAHPEPDINDAIRESVLEELTTNLNSWDQYFTHMIAIGIFGGQVTFNIVLSDIYDPQKVFAGRSSPLVKIDKETVRLFVALAFMFFVVTLGVAGVGKVILSNPTIKTQIRQRLGKRKYTPLEWFEIAACCIDYFPILAFLFLGLAVIAYVPGVGLAVTIIVVICLIGKMFYGHVVITDLGSWWPFRLVAATWLWVSTP